ncbi:MAG: pitrilysin family protein [Patescibacteria group bacterium]
MKIKKRYCLANKLPVVIASRAATEAVTVLALVHTGSRLEKSAEAGVSHFLEHMVFKGTVSWPTAEELTHVIDGLGADYNAYTSKEVTGFYIKAAAGHLKTILKLLSEMLWQAKIDAAEMGREKEVIVQEINMYEDNPMLFVEDVLESAMFPDHNLGKLISGSRQSVRSLTKQQVHNYLDRFYHPQNMLLVVTGKIDNRTEKLIDKTFGRIRPAGILPKYDRVITKTNRPRVVVKFKKTEQVQLALGLPALPLRHRDMVILELLSVILGGNMSSRLFSRLREREGLCYFVKSLVQAYENAGVLSVQAGLDKARLPRAVKLIREELERVTKQPIPAAEITKAKEYLRGKFLLALEDSAGVAEFLGKQIMLEKKLETPEQVIRKLQKVTGAQLQRVARAIIKPKCYTLAMIGPFKDAKPFNSWLK